MIKNNYTQKNSKKWEKTMKLYKALSQQMVDF